MEERQFLDSRYALAVLLVEISFRAFSLIEEIKDHAEVFNRTIYFTVGFCPKTDRFYLFKYFLCFPGIVPEFGLVGNSFLFFDQGFLLVDVKETSSRLQASYSML